MAEERTSIFKGMSAEISGMKKTEKKKKKGNIKVGQLSKV